MMVKMSEEIEYVGEENGYKVFKGYEFTLYYNPETAEAEIWTKEPIGYEGAVTLLHAIKDELPILGIYHAYGVWDTQGNYISLIHLSECDNGRCPFFLRSE